MHFNLCLGIAHPSLTGRELKAMAHKADNIVAADRSQVLEAEDRFRLHGEFQRSVR